MASAHKPQKDASLDCIRLDLEDPNHIAWGLQQNQNASGEGVWIDVLYGNDTDLTWTNPIDDIQLSQIMEMPPFSLRVCFISFPQVGKNWLSGNFTPRSQTIRILRKAGLSGILLSSLFSEDGYWAKMGNQRYLSYDEKGNLSSFEICYQYRRGRNLGISFVHALRSKKQTTYFCINYPSGARQRLEDIFRHPEKRAVFYQDFFFDSILADDCLKQWQYDIGQRRLILFHLESFGEIQISEEVDSEQSLSYKEELGSRFTKNAFRKPEQSDPEQQLDSHSEPSDTKTGFSGMEKRLLFSKYAIGKGPDDFDTATRNLHKIVRDWLGLRQDCEDMLRQLQFLHETYTRVSGELRDNWFMGEKVDRGEVFEALRSQCDMCIRSTQVYQDRTETRIGLLYHLANQKTAAETTKIAEQTKRDSASMITIAAVTMIFLPGTFVCTVVSTSFFDFGNEGMQVSRQWWILLAVAIPLTIFVFAIWWFWQGMTNRLISRYQHLKERAKKEKGT